MPKLKSTLPKGDANGLGPVALSLLRDPHRMQVIIAIVDCAKTEIDHDVDEQIPVIRVRRVEGVLREDMAAAQRLMRRALEFRTGRHVLPLELEDDIQLAFDAVDGGIDGDDPETAS